MMQFNEADLPSSSSESEMANDTNSNANGTSRFVFKRSQCKEFPTAVVGDVGTCKNNRSVRNKDQSRYGWSTEVPGNMHTKGYLCEAVFKAHGVGGFHKVVNNVMNRPKLTKEGFQKAQISGEQSQSDQRKRERRKLRLRDGSSAGISKIVRFSNE